MKAKSLSGVAASTMLSPLVPLRDLYAERGESLPGSEYFSRKCLCVAKDENGRDMH